MNFLSVDPNLAIVDKKQNLQKIKDAMNNKKFINLMKYLAFKEDNKYNYKIIALFKKIKSGYSEDVLIASE